MSGALPVGEIEEKKNNKAERKERTGKFQKHPPYQGRELKKKKRETNARTLLGTQRRTKGGRKRLKGGQMISRRTSHETKIEETSGPA